MNSLLGQVGDILLSVGPSSSVVVGSLLASAGSSTDGQVVLALGHKAQ